MAACTIRLSVLMLVALAPLGGCAGVTGRTGTPAAEASAPLRPISGPCGTAISEFETVLKNDQAIGHLSATAYRRILTDLEPAKADCAARRSREANGRLAAIRSRYGYR